MTREEAIEWFLNSPFYHKGHVPFEMAIEALKAEPVKHGHWQFAPDDSEGVCTACCFKIYGIPYAGKYMIVPYNYCPNCGAKMEGVENEID